MCHGGHLGELVWVSLYFIVMLWFVDCILTTWSLYDVFDIQTCRFEINWHAMLLPVQTSHTTGRIESISGGLYEQE